MVPVTSLASGARIEKSCKPILYLAGRRLANDGAVIRDADINEVVLMKLRRVVSLFPIILVSMFDPFKLCKAIKFAKRGSHRRGIRLKILDDWIYFSSNHVT